MIIEFKSMKLNVRFEILSNYIFLLITLISYFLHQLRIIVNQNYHSIVSCKLGANKLSSMHEVQNELRFIVDSYVEGCL